MMRKRQGNKHLLFIIIFICSPLVVIGAMKYLFSPSYKPINVVEAFYMYEQEGAFADSWELIHPLMKERWSKTQFVDDRSHVFIGHFDAETFQFSINDDGKMKDWKMTEEAEPFDVTYKFTVVQSYRGTYGKFSFLQEVYVVNDEGAWRILWDYN